MNIKPLFIPLKGEHYDAFVTGNKDTERRLLGPRWNLKTCFPKRQVILSRGYGKQNRATGWIKEARVTKFSNLDVGIKRALQGCYGFAAWDNPEIICVEIWDIIEEVKS